MPWKSLWPEIPRVPSALSSRLHAPHTPPPRDTDAPDIPPRNAPATDIHKPFPPPGNSFSTVTSRRQSRNTSRRLVQTPLREAGKSSPSPRCHPPRRAGAFYLPWDTKCHRGHKNSIPQNPPRSNPRETCYFSHKKWEANSSDSVPCTFHPTATRETRHVPLRRSLSAYTIPPKTTPRKT